MVYFNEHDKFAAEWLGNLYPEAHVDPRDIQDVKPADLVGFERCHFFGGVGGWEHALDLAGFTGSVWTGSCPCQSISGAGKRKGEKDERHLWPEFYRLIRECRPAIIFGEQTRSGDGPEWLDGISLDLEELGYAVGSSDLCAAGVKAPQARQRLYWVAIAEGERSWAPSFSEGDCPSEIEGRFVESGRHSAIERLAIANGERVRGRRSAEDAGKARAREGERAERKRVRIDSRNDGNARGLVDSGSARLTLSQCEVVSGSGREDEGRAIEQPGCAWGFATIDCRDGERRRVSAEPSAFPLAHGIPRDLGRRFPELRPLAKGARANRVGRLRGYGNAIVPQVAAMFIQAAMEARRIQQTARD